MSPDRSTSRTSSPGDEEAGDHEEHVDADEPARDGQGGVEEQDQEDRQASKALDVRPEPDGIRPGRSIHVTDPAPAFARSPVAAAARVSGVGRTPTLGGRRRRVGRSLCSVAPACRCDARGGWSVAVVGCRPRSVGLCRSQSPHVTRAVVDTRPFPRRRRSPIRQAHPRPTHHRLAEFCGAARRHGVPRRADDRDGRGCRSHQPRRRAGRLRMEVVLAERPPRPPPPRVDASPAPHGHPAADDGRRRPSFRDPCRRPRPQCRHAPRRCARPVRRPGPHGPCRGPWRPTSATRTRPVGRTRALAGGAGRRS